MLCHEGEARSLSVWGDCLLIGGDAGRDALRATLGIGVAATALWKSCLVPPERAGHRGNVLMSRVYAEFERLRLRQVALTVAYTSRFSVSLSRN